MNDSWDKRCVSIILTSIVNPELTSCSNPLDATSVRPYNPVPSDDRYSMSFITGKTTLTDISEKIKLLPNIDQTDVFGMSQNSDVVNQQSEAARIIQRILGVSADCLSQVGEDKKENDEQKP